jgi:hypothetical protein
MIGWLLSRRPPRVPERFTLAEGDCFLDGGTTVLRGTDERGRLRTIRLTQQSLPRCSWWDPPVGRLYVNGRLVPMRGDAERAVLAVLEAAVTEVLTRLRLAPEPVPADAGPAQAILFGSPDLAELYSLDDSWGRLAWMAQNVIEYVRSPDAGRELVLDEFEAGGLE